MLLNTTKIALQWDVDNTYNHKQIGLLYLTYGVFTSVIGVILSIMIKSEILYNDCSIFLKNTHQVFNAVVTAHAFIMIFLKI